MYDPILRDEREGERVRVVALEARAVEGSLGIIKNLQPFIPKEQMDTARNPCPWEDLEIHSSSISMRRIKAPFSIILLVMAPEKRLKAIFRENILQTV